MTENQQRSLCRVHIEGNSGQLGKSVAPYSGSIYSYTAPHFTYYKEHPEMGVGIEDSRNDTDPEELLRSIRQEFAADGMKVSKVAITATGNIETDASYENS